MDVLNLKFLFLTFPAEAQILHREVQLNSLKNICLGVVVHKAFSIHT